jgi:N-hydroxyarylamine O-acetyltransferase
VVSREEITMVQVEQTDREVNVDLDAYLARIGYEGELAPTLETLRGLHFAHATRIPFENLDILLGRPIALDLDSLQKKLVAGGRGGYCFEHNSLFAAALESLGFEVTRLAARVQMGAATIRPRTHMLLSVAVDGEAWLADVGFGGGGLLHPIPLRPGEGDRQFERRFRLDVNGDVRVLQSLRREGWLDLYTFTMEPQYGVDYEVANHYTSTHPHSPFTRTVIAQRNSPEGSRILRNRVLTEERPGQEPTMTTLPDDDALLGALYEHFGLRFPQGTRFRYVENESA